MLGKPTIIPTLRKEKQGIPSESQPVRLDEFTTLGTTERLICYVKYRMINEETQCHSQAPTYRHEHVEKHLHTSVGTHTHIRMHYMHATYTYKKW